MNVSITVISYNSANTIIQTLDSILAQDYDTQRIELIISDDASTDNCLDVIGDWLLKNEDSFLKVNFIQNKINKGVTRNCNIAWRAATCEWIKPIAGDDILMSNCISDNVEYVKGHPKCKIVFSKMRWFGSEQKTTPEPYNLGLFKVDSEQQHNWFKVFSFNMAPTAFIKKELLEIVGYADESIKSIEDKPLWLNITKAGYKLYFFDKVTVKYRRSESISTSDYKYININYLKDLIAINNNYKVPFFRSPIREIMRNEQLLMYKSMHMISVISGNKKSKCTTILGRSTWLLRPIHLIQRIKFKTYNTYVNIQKNRRFRYKE